MPFSLRHACSAALLSFLLALSEPSPDRFRPDNLAAAAVLAAALFLAAGIIGGLLARRRARRRASDRG